MAEGVREQGHRGVGGISHRVAEWIAWIVGGAAFAFSTSALFLVEFNGENIGSSDTTGSAILALSFAGVGAFVASQRPGNPIGWILLTGGFFNSLNAFSFEYSKYALVTDPGQWPSAPFFVWLGTWAFAVSFAVFPLTLLLFPTGRPPSPRWRPVLWLVAAGSALLIVPMAVSAWSLRGPGLVSANPWADEIGGGLAVALQEVGTWLVGLGMLASVISLALRFRRAGDKECQQIKWLLYAGALTLVVLVTVSPAAPFDLPSGIELVFGSLALLALPSIPIAVGIAILKYRLYYIDVVINRTLVYGSLTAMLVVAYLSSVVALQRVLRALTGQESQLAVVASTLAIAALFSPLRRRVQAFIDRRFYRRKYDARKTLEAFSARLRNETDLDTLNNHLVEVARETMQPTHVSLWLRPDTPPKTEQAD